MAPWLHSTARGYDYRSAESMTRRGRINKDALQGDPDAQTELARVKVAQRRLTTQEKVRLAALNDAPNLIVPGHLLMVAHALVLPGDDPEKRQRHDAPVEAVAMEIARIYEERVGATVKDVSRPNLARQAGLTDWPGFDLQSHRPRRLQVPSARTIEVKGHAGGDAIEMRGNEWAAACKHRDRNWLYVAYDCTTAHPKLVRVQDPFGQLLAKQSGDVVIGESQLQSVDRDQVSRNSK